MIRVPSWRLVSGGAFILLLFVALTGAVQAQVLTGNIIGSIRDESGAMLPGVTVTISSPALPAGPVTVVTNEKGEYRFTQLDPGTYAMSVTLPGFSSYQEQDLRVVVSGTIERTVTLKVATVAETITVSGESPMVDPRQVGVAANVTEEAIEQLPARRNVANAYLKWAGAGVSPSDPSGYNASVSVMGSGTGENSILYEGIMGNSPGGGGYWAQGDLEAAEELQVTTLGASAEYQVAQGAVFSIVTKQGTNQFRFDATGHWYPDKLISKPIKLPCGCSLGETGFTSISVKDYAAHGGGPLIKDRLWFFGGGIWSSRWQGNPGIDARLPRTHYNYTALGKVTWQINDRLKVRQHYDAQWWNNPPLPTVARPYETVTAGGGIVKFYATELNATLSNTTLLTARVGGFWDPDDYTKPLTGNITAPIRMDAATGLSCCGVPSFGTSTLARHSQAVKVNKYIQTASFTHDLRFGVQFEYARSTALSAFPSGVNYSDNRGAPDQATFRDPSVSGAEYTSQGVWAEDQLTRGRITLSLGARFDRMHAVSPDLPAIDNQIRETGATVSGLGDMFTWTAFAPRVGFNLKLTDDGKTVMRGHYGRAFRTIYLGDFTAVHPGIPVSTLARFDPVTQAYSTIISRTDPRANIGVDSESEAPFTDSASIGIDRELIANLGVGATYVYKYGQKQIGWVDVGGVYGTRDEVLPDGRVVTVYPLLNATSARRFLRTNGPGSFNRYHGLVLSMQKRWSQSWQGSVSYTRSRSEGLTSTGQDPNDDINNGGLQTTDRTHIFVGGATYEVPRVRLMVSGHLMAVSGNPYAPQALVSLPQGRRSVNIEPATGEYRQSTQKLLYLRFGRDVFKRGHRRVELAAEVANLLQDKSSNSIISRNFFSTTFGQPGEWIEPRRMFFVAKLWM
jgi:hypothetical protein